MTDIVQPDSYFPDRRPSLLRRVVDRYQLVELTVIIGAILLLWGAVSLPRVHAALLDAPGAMATGLCGTLIPMQSGLCR
ncbi:MAG TPA: hypothetical protein VLB11_05210 [Methyloceanibacter sp.]|nr:hypothetical protein [Methyloceanibacter sp.]